MSDEQRSTDGGEENPDTSSNPGTSYPNEKSSEFPSEEKPPTWKKMLRSSKVTNGGEGAEEPPNEDGESESDIDFGYGASAVIHVTVPVCICMILVIFLVKVLEIDPEKATHTVVLAPFNTKDASTTTKSIETLQNVAIIVAAILVMTFALFLLYKFRCYMIMKGYMMFVTFLLIVLFGGTYSHKLLVRYNQPMDWISISLLLWNLLMCAEMSIHYKGPLLLQQTMLILVSVLMALMFIETLPDWTGWAILAAVSVYDLCAVLTPVGPLKMLVDLAQERNEEFFPALIYNSGIVWGLGVTMATGDSEEEDQRKSSGIKLGLGDFIFYSLLVGKASVNGDWCVIMACFSSIIVGLCLTLLLLVLFKRALPALPISIGLALIMYFSSYYSISPFMDALVEAQVII